jgi:hypothetical protein
MRAFCRNSLRMERSILSRSKVFPMLSCFLHHYIGCLVFCQLMDIKLSFFQISAGGSQSQHDPVSNNGMSRRQRRFSRYPHFSIIIFNT